MSGMTPSRGRWPSPSCSTKALRAAASTQKSSESAVRLLAASSSRMLRTSLEMLYGVHTWKAALRASSKLSSSTGTPSTQRLSPLIISLKAERSLLFEGDLSPCCDRHCSAAWISSTAYGRWWCVTSSTVSRLKESAKLWSSGKGRCNLKSSTTLSGFDSITQCSGRLVRKYPTSPYDRAISKGVLCCLQISSSLMTSVSRSCVAITKLKSAKKLGLVLISSSGSSST
mmetsp:Transcript_8982/g.19250  ORF Transcript_8982/g.19250 Transcript_8982/m.19250 type:complete len:228 (-) Transcript_8982:377-1060(-)